MEFDISNLTVTTALWLLVALVGLSFAWENLGESGRDRHDAEEINNGLREARLVVANGYVFRNRIRVAIFAWWVLLGVVFGFFEPPPVIGFGGLMGLVVTALGWTIIGFQETQERRLLRRIVRLQGGVQDEANAKITRKAEITAAKTVQHAQSVLDMVERTADNTERIADNTDSLRGGIGHEMAKEPEDQG